MKPLIPVVVVIPIGPGCQPAFVADTIDSFVFYCRSDYRIILADDSQKGTGRAVAVNYEKVEVMETRRSMGKLCGLYITLSEAFRLALSKYHFDALLRLDTDALIIGDDPAEEAVRLFKLQPRIGIAGQYPLDYEGRPWDISWPREQIIKYTSTLRFFKHTIAHYKLRRLYHKALKNGYRTGESVFGGACFYSEGGLRALQEANLLPTAIMHNVNLEEDHLFSLMMKAIGYDLADLSSGRQPFGCAWKGLPAPPTELVQRHKKIIHSTRFWKDWDEKAIREFFRQRRMETTAPFYTHADINGYGLTRENSNR